MSYLPQSRDSIRILNWLASFHIFHSCNILVYSIGHTGFLLHLGSFQHCNLGEFVWPTQVQAGSRGFYFPRHSILQRNFPNFGMEILALRSAKSFRGLYFSWFCSSVAHIVQKLVKTRSSHRRCSLRKSVLTKFTKFTGKHLCQSLHFNKVAGLACNLACNFIKIETLAQVFSC